MNGAEPSDLDPRWLDAQFALIALQMDPAGFCGVWMRAGHGPVRDAWLEQLHATGCRVCKIPAQVDDDRLLGGIDLARTLRTGSVVYQAGLLSSADGGVILLSMAERLTAQLASHLYQTQDQGVVLPRHGGEPAASRYGLVALDESDEDEPGLCAALADRLGIWLDLRDITLAQSAQRVALLQPQEMAEAKLRLQAMSHEPQHLQALCEVSLVLGVDSLRACSAALRLACLHAAVHGRDALEDEDLAAAVRLVFGPRATRLPQQESPVEPSPEAKSASEPDDESAFPPPPQPPEETDGSDAFAGDAEQAPKDVLLAAALASLPQKLLDSLLVGQTGSPQAKVSGSKGQTMRGLQRGRPLAPRPGRPGAGSRLHLLATLRAAAPKQRLRKRWGSGRIAIRAEDFQLHRFEQHRPSCLIFALDASGSAAQQRLAEAKGAVELLLEQSYSRRDSVCVIAFRGTQAQLLLPPTRSLVRAKRELAGLPGGGGTPLASGIQTAFRQAEMLHRNGSTPMLVLLSDGRANVALSGVGGRAQAQADAQVWAQRWCSKRFASLWIDTSKQPDPRAKELAARMGALYVPMPYVDARRMASVVESLRHQQSSA